MFNTPVKQEGTTNATTKRSYSYTDLMRMQSSQQIYSSIGKIISSKKPSAPRATIDKADKEKNKKIYIGQELAKLDNKCKQGLGPAAYLPSRELLPNGQVHERKNPDEALKYHKDPSYSIGKGPRKPPEGAAYNYMRYKNDDMNVDRADLARRKSSPAIRIGTNPRFHQLRLDKGTPGPSYNPNLKPQIPNQPEYTIQVRRPLKGQDPLVPTTCTTNLVGPSTYFQKGNNKSHSTSALSRVPYDSTRKNEPVVGFTKQSKFKQQYKSSIDETYDIKNKTIMNHYDFQYDHGKGLNSGLAYMKKNILKSSQYPLEKNKMASFTMPKAKRQKDQQKGHFIQMMSQVPQSIRIEHPKF